MKQEISRKAREQLKESYENACNAYAYAFCLKHGYELMGDGYGTYWVADTAGGILAVGDEFATMEEIRTDLDMNAPEEEWRKWYDYTLDAMYVFGLDHPSPNYENWLKGAPRMNVDTLEHIRIQQERIKQQILKLKDNE